MKPSAKKPNFGAKPRVFAVKPGPVLVRSHQRHGFFFGASLDILQNTKNKIFPEKSFFFEKKWFGGENFGFLLDNGQSQ